MTQTSIGTTVTQGVSAPSGVINEPPIGVFAALMERERGIPNTAIRITSIQEDALKFGDSSPIGALSREYIELVDANRGAYGLNYVGVRVLDETQCAVAKGSLYVNAPGNATITVTTTVQGVYGTTGKVVRVTVAGFAVGDTVGFVLGGLTISYTVQLGDTASTIYTAWNTAITTAQGNGNLDALGVTSSAPGTYLQLTEVVNSLVSTGIVTDNPLELQFSSVPTNLPSGKKVRVVPSVGTAPTPDANLGIYWVATGSSASRLLILADPNLTQTTAVGIASPTQTFTLTYSSEPQVSPFVNYAGNTEVATIWAGQKGKKDPGDWANYTQSSGGVQTAGVRVAYQKPVAGNSNKHTLVVTYVKGSSIYTQTHAAQTLSELFEIVNRDSDYVTIQKRSDQAIAVNQTVRLSGGIYSAPVEQDYYPVPDDSAPKGLAVLDTEFTIDTIVCPEITTQSMAQVMQVYTSNRSDVHALFTPAFGASTPAVESLAQALSTSTLESARLSIIHAWARKADEVNELWIPWTAVTIGAGLIRKRNAQGQEANIPAAGTDAPALNVSDHFPKLSPASIDRLALNFNVNCVVFKPKYGRYQFTSRTTSSNELYISQSVMYGTDFIVRILRENFDNLGQNISSPEFWSIAIQKLNNLGTDLYRRGYLERSVPQDTSWKIISDTSNNPVTQSRRERNLDVQYVPAECVETVTIRLNRNDGVLSISQIS